MSFILQNGNFKILARTSCEKKDFRPKIKVCIRLPLIPLFANPYTFFLNIVGDFKDVQLYCFPIFTIKIKLFSYFKISCITKHIFFMFGLKNEKLILLIHVVVLFIYNLKITSRQTDEWTDRLIDLLQMYRS